MEADPVAGLTLKREPTNPTKTQFQVWAEEVGYDAWAKQVGEQKLVAIDSFLL